MLKYDYLKLLESQCDAIIDKDINKTKSAFSAVCRSLTRDFLPPLERADIAAISFSLLNIAIKAKDTVYPDAIRKQMILQKGLINSLFKKKKTCGEDIRRAIEINSDFKTQNQSLLTLNASLNEFFRLLLSAYFANL